MHRFQTAPLQLKFAADETTTGEFSGYAATYDREPDRHGDIIAPSAFAESLEQHRRNGTNPALLWHHDQTKAIGAWTSFEDTPKGLLANGRLTLDVPEAQTAYALMSDGALALSIGYKVAPADTELINGARLLKKIDLIEVSVVAVPANINAKIAAVKCFDPKNPNPRIFEKAARDALGLSASQAKRLMSGGWSRLAREESELDPEELSAIAVKLQRITQALRG